MKPTLFAKGNKRTLKHPVAIAADKAMAENASRVFAAHTRRDAKHREEKASVRLPRYCTYNRSSVHTWVTLWNETWRCKSV